MKASSYLAKAAVLSIAFLVASCGKNYTVNTTKEIPAGKSLVILQAFSDPPMGLFAPGALAVYFNRFDPPSPRQGFWVNGKLDRNFAVPAAPGKYHFLMFRTINVDYLFEPHNPRYEFEVKPGEAAYIGNIVNKHKGGYFRIEVRNTEADAKKFFDEKFGDSGLKFIRRPMRRVIGLNPVLPR